MIYRFILGEWPILANGVGPLEKAKGRYVPSEKGNRDGYKGEIETLFRVNPILIGNPKYYIPTGNPRIRNPNLGSEELGFKNSRVSQDLN
eukprot:SAG11_NODE_884_length_6733_cov_3.462617_6_plen_90_part_00